MHEAGSIRNRGELFKLAARGGCRTVNAEEQVLFWMGSRYLVHTPSAQIIIRAHRAAIANTNDAVLAIIAESFVDPRLPV